MKLKSFIIEEVVSIDYGNFSVSLTFHDGVLVNLVFNYVRGCVRGNEILSISANNIGLLSDELADDLLNKFLDVIESVVRGWLDADVVIETRFEELWSINDQFLR